MIWKKTIWKTLKILLSFLVSGILCYYAFRGIEIGNVLDLIRKTNLLYIGGIVAVLVLTQILRSLRWSLMLNPIAPLNQKFLFYITSIGFLFIVLLPARLGELARPYLLQQNSQINFSSGMATVVMERILDTVFILGLFAYCIVFIEQPKWVVDAAKLFTLSILLVAGLLIAGGLQKSRTKVKMIIHVIFPNRLAVLVEKFLEKFYIGMSVLRKGRHTLIIIVLSAFIWGTLVMVNSLLFRAIGMNLGTLAAIYVLVLTTLSVAVPAGPGFIGNYHFACVFALSFFNVNKELAIGYALMLHALIICTIVFLGIGCLNITRINVGLGFLKGKAAEKPIRSS